MVLFFLISLSLSLSLCLSLPSLPLSHMHTCDHTHQDIHDTTCACTCTHTMSCIIVHTCCNASPLTFQFLSPSSPIRLDLICPLMSTLGIMSASDTGACEAPPTAPPPPVSPDSPSASSSSSWATLGPRVGAGGDWAVTWYSKKGIYQIQSVASNF